MPPRGDRTSAPRLEAVLGREERPSKLPEGADHEVPALFRTRLAEAGCAIRDDKPVEGYARFFTEDPFGNRIELMERVS